MFKLVIHNKDKPDHPWVWYIEDEAVVDKTIALELKKFTYTPIVEKILMSSQEVAALTSAKAKEEQREKRRFEYPSIEECVEALLEEFEGRPEKLLELSMKREEIKGKYPF